MRDRASTRGRVSAITLAILAAWLLAAPADAGLNAWSSNGPPNVSILSLAVDPLTPGIVYAGSNGNGIFRSKDGGASWVPVNHRPLPIPSWAPSPSTRSAPESSTRGPMAAACSGASTVVELGARQYRPRQRRGHRARDQSRRAHHALRRRDGPGCVQERRRRRELGRDQCRAHQLRRHRARREPREHQCRVRGHDRGRRVRSFNAGGSWAAASSGLVNTLVSALAINPVTPAILYAGTTGGGVFRSADGGTSWAPVNDGITNVNTIITSLVIDPRAPNILYASAPGTVCSEPSMPGPAGHCSMRGSPIPSSMPSPSPRRASACTRRRGAPGSSTSRSTRLAVRPSRWRRPSCRRAARSWSMPPPPRSRQSSIRRRARRWDAASRCSAPCPRCSRFRPPIPRRTR